MQELEITQSALAKELGIGQSSISAWFRDHNMPHGLYLSRFPRAIWTLRSRWVNGHWLLTGTEPVYCRVADERPDQAYVRGGLSAVAEIEQTLVGLRARLLKADQISAAGGAPHAATDALVAAEVATSPQPQRAVPEPPRRKRRRRA